MTVYVDSLFKYDKSYWCHMWVGPTDDVEELHKMALAIGLKLEWFQDNHADFPHYDLRSTKRALAVKNGAKEVSRKTMVIHKRHREYIRINKENKE